MENENPKNKIVAKNNDIIQSNDLTTEKNIQQNIPTNTNENTADKPTAQNVIKNQGKNTTKDSKTYSKKPIEKKSEKFDYQKQQLQLIPKMQNYITYMFDVVLEKIPRTEKYSLGTSYKNSMYNMLRSALFINKITRRDTIIYNLNCIDADMDFQRCLLRVLHNRGRISNERYNYILGMLYEIGKMLGGLISYYYKNI